MANHVQLREIAKSRLRAAKILIEHGDYDGAVYLLGYVVELALKAVICKTLHLNNYPDRGGVRDKEDIFKTHKLEILLTLSGMENDFILTAPARRSENWSAFTFWNTAIRYEPIGTRTEVEARRLIEALEEKPDGIITWIKRRKKW